MDSRLVFHHQDGDLSFGIISGVYNLSPSGTLSCSVACSFSESAEFMGSPQFAMLSLAAGEGLYVGQTLEVHSQATSEDICESRPLTHLYAGEHYSPWNARLTVVAVQESSIDVHGSFVTADPNYYDERAKPTHVEFWASLKASPPTAIWRPL
ncbi:hypothetical protein [Methylibium rhizosphaerae]|uniref:hypothetical protein n=1 Tax=Methylibium rhizosphaerae TaxID=2570323 RepID=UPI00112A4768|nr:hypothetical protein [Methylibium rhizosphaerae]